MHGYVDYDYRVHLFDTYQEAYDAWAADNNCGPLSMPRHEGMDVADNRTAPVTALIRQRTRAIREGSFEHFTSLGQ